MIEFYDENNDIVNFVYFFEENTKDLDIADFMKRVIGKVYKFEENNPQILFNIRYLKIV